MSPRRPPPTKPKIDWGAASFVLALTLAVIAGIVAYYAFNGSLAKQMSDVERDVAILNQQVADLREAERDRRRRPDVQ